MGDGLVGEVEEEAEDEDGQAERFVGEIGVVAVEVNLLGAPELVDRDAE